MATIVLLAVLKGAGYCLALYIGIRMGQAIREML